MRHPRRALVPLPLSQPIAAYVLSNYSKVLEHSMEALVSRHEGTAIVKDVRTEIDKLLRQLYGEPGAKEEGGKGGGSRTRPRVRGADRKGARQEVRRQ